LLLLDVSTRFGNFFVALSPLFPKFSPGTIHCNSSKGYLRFGPERAKYRFYKKWYFRHFLMSCFGLLPVGTDREYPGVAIKYPATTIAPMNQYLLHLAMLPFSINDHESIPDVLVNIQLFSFEDHLGDDLRWFNLAD